MNKSAETQYPIHDLLKNRWSPRALSPEPIPADQVFSLLEAARWSPSSNNMQPWLFIVTSPDKPKAHAKLVATLGEFNQIWAKDAPLLILSIVKRDFEPGKPNGAALYDLGQAVAHLSFQASALGLYTHQMGGFDRQKAREVFELPEGYDPATVIAVGKLGDPNLLPERLLEREVQPRMRKQLAEFAFDGAWQVPLVAESQPTPAD